jgi:DNA helicase II / ATP-dependent DNA helicase PcrA
VKFTKEQLKAIGHSEGHLQLIACAGSGKTEVVARRIANLLDQSASPRFTPANIIAFTFTDKAAAELKQRVTDRVREAHGDLPGLAEMFVGTIHAFCLELLKAEVPQYMKFEVLNQVQQSLLIDRNSRQSGLTTTTDLDGRPLRRYTDTQRYVEALAVLREAHLDEPALRGTSIVGGLRSYQSLVRDKRYLDYSAIMEEAVKALAADKALKERLAVRVKHLIVDEYQDVNPIQEALVRLFAEMGAHICVVGDDDQTIYQWRGSDVGNILTFKKRYRAVTEARLQENFRSNCGIVETAREFIAQNTERLDKAMVPTDAQPYETGDLVALSFDNPEAEAAFIAETIKSLIGVAFTDPDGTQRGLSYADMAILLRSVRTNGQPITEALETANIPYVVSGMNNLFDTAEAEAARQLFYFMAGRPDTDESQLAGIWSAADIGLRKASIKGAIRKAAQAQAAMRDEAEQKRWSYYSLQRQFLTFLEDIGLQEDTVPANRGEVVFYNLGKFSQLISDFESIHYQSDPVRKYDEFAKFLQFQAESTYPEGWQDNQYANPNAVRIMTVHQAKGMQWPVVFVPALLRNRFPAPRMGGRNVWHLVPREGVVGQQRYEGTLEDERRLFYVAMTRSQKFLFLTWAPIDGKNNRYRRASEFWDDVLVSKYLKRRRQDYSSRPRLSSRPRASIANVTLSFSDLKYFFECPYQFKLRILYGFNAPIHEALGYGKSLHDALAEVHARAIRGDVPDESEVARLVETHLHVPYAYPSLRETLENSAEKVIHNYLRDNATDFANIEFSEKFVEINLGDGVTVSGRIDLVRRRDTGETTIVDLKSTDRAQAEDVTETQLHIYALGYQELTGRNANYVEIYNLDERKKKPRSVDEDLIDDVKGHVRRAAKALRDNEMPAVVSARACPSCDYLRLCSAGREFVAASKTRTA